MSSEKGQGLEERRNRHSKTYLYFGFQKGKATSIDGSFPQYFGGSQTPHTTTQQSEDFLNWYVIYSISHNLNRIYPLNFTIKTPCPLKFWQHFEKILEIKLTLIRTFLMKKANKKILPEKAKLGLKLLTIKIRGIQTWYISRTCQEKCAIL